MKQKNTKADIAWAIRNPRGGIYFYSVTSERQSAIAEHVSVQHRSWNACRKSGDRAVKIKIELLTKR
jgi:hypothetical protein